MAEGDLGILNLPGFTIGAAQSSLPGAWSPLIVDAGDLSGRRIKIAQLPSGTLALAETDDVGYYGVITMSTADAVGRAWKLIDIGGVEFTLVQTTVANVWAVLTIDAADANAANYRTVTTDAGNITLVATGTPGKRAVLVKSEADVSGTVSVSSFFGRSFAINGGVVVSGSAPTYADYLQAFVSAATLPLWLRFRETTGTNAVNAGSATLTTTIGGTTTLGQTGKLGTNDAHLLDGLTSLYTVANNVALSTESEITHAALINPSSAGEGNNGAIYNWGNSNSAECRMSGGLNALLGHVDAGTDALSTPLVLTADVWQWVFMTYSNSGDRYIRLYKGVGGAVTEASYGTFTAAVGSLVTQSADLILGNRAVGDRTFAGLIDEQLRFSVVLSAAQMLQIVQLTGV